MGVRERSSKSVPVVVVGFSAFWVETEGEAWVRGPRSAKGV